MSDNIWQHMSEMGKNSVEIMEHMLNNQYITSVIYANDFKIDEMKSLYGGMEHFCVTKRIAPKDNLLSIEKFSSTIIEPMIGELVKEIKLKRKEYASITLSLPECSIAGVTVYGNIALRILKGYNMETMSSELHIDIALIEKK